MGEMFKQEKEGNTEQTESDPDFNVELALYYKELAVLFPSATEEQASKILSYAKRLTEERIISRRTSSRLQQQIDQLQPLVGTDQLTGLDNTRRFWEEARRELANALRRGEIISFIFIDIDDFKDVNDTLGHLKGDEVLREISTTLKRQIRTGDRASRYGGEEFILTCLTSGNNAIGVAERTRKAVEDKHITYQTGEGLKKVTISLGVSSILPEGNPATITDSELTTRLNQAIADADQAMYFAKERGKNSTGFIDDKGRIAALEPSQQNSAKRLSVYKKKT